MTLKWWIIASQVIILYVVGTVSLMVEINTAVVIPCEVETSPDYPSWSGPPTTISGLKLAYSRQPNPDFNPNLGEDKLRRLSWAGNKKDLNLSAVKRSDEGEYLCIAVPGGIANVTITVRVPPALPFIYNTAIGPQNQLTVSGTEGTPLTLTFISVGGFPQQTLNWYRESVSSTPLPAGFPIVVSGDLYNVTRSYTFTPTSSDDGVKYICQSSYNGEPQLIRTTEVKLFLKLRPSSPTVTVLGNPTESSSSINIARCTSSGFRPQTVSLGWTLSGGTEEPVSNPSVEENAATNTFSVSDTYSRVVGRADNGKTLTCTINHETLSSPQNASGTLIVQFPPNTATLTGSFTTVADGSSKTFTCETGTSRPDAAITWQRNNADITAGTETPTYTTGNYSGRLTTQTLTITPTRDDDGDVYSCSARNTASRTPANSQQKTLTLTYHPITSVACQSSPVTEGSQVSLSCTASSKPTSSFTWFHGSTTISKSQGPVASNEFNHVISSVNRTHYGLYTCIANNGLLPDGESSCSLEVKFSAVITTITGNPSMVANGVNRVSLTCTTGFSNPASSITWFLNGQVVVSDAPVQESVGQYSGKVISQVLKLTPTRDMDGDVIKCRAGNGLSGTSFVEDQVALNLKYSPVVTIVSRLETETQPGLLRCLVSGKPAASVKWYRTDNGQTLLLEGTGNGSLDYTLGAVSRDDAGAYKCTAKNGIGGDISSTVQLVVQYKPDVTVIAENATENSSSTLRCEPHGEPDSFTFISWEQMWPGSGIALRTLPGSEVLTLRDLRYEHTGIYTCRVDNGVELSRNPSAGQGQVFFVVKSRPLVTSDQRTIQKAAQLGNVTTIWVEFVSNFHGTNIRVEKRGQDTDAQSTQFNTTTISANISVVIFSKTVQTEGFLSKINIPVVNQDDFGLYDIVIENDVGIENIAVNLVPKGPPSTPVIILITHITETSALLTWTRGFHGGSDQTVKVEISRDWVGWTPTLSLPQGMLVDTSPVNTTINELLPASRYYLRMFSTNEEGDSSKTDLFTFATKEEEITPNNASVIGGVAVGSIGLIVAVIVLVFILRRKYTFDCSCNMSVSRKEDVDPVHNGHGADNPEYNAALTYEDVSTAKETQVYDAFNDGNDRPDNSHVYTSLDESNPKSQAYYQNVKRKDPVYHNTVLKNPVQTVL